MRRGYQAAYRGARLDGLYGDAAPLIDVLSAGLGVIVRSRDYHLLDLEIVQQALAHAPDQVSTHPESGMTRTLYDCPARMGLKAEILGQFGWVPMIGTE